MKSGLELLRSGLAKIEAGWLQGRLRKRIDGQVCYCALGAMGVTDLDNEKQVNRAAKLLWPALPEEERHRCYPDGGDVWNYNDDIGRTRADVVALYKRAISIEESKP